MALVEQDAQELRGHVHIHAFELAGLELRTLVVIKGQVAQALELHRLVPGAGAALRSQTGEELDLGGDLALMGKELDLPEMHGAVELEPDLLRKFAETRGLPAPRLRGMCQQLGDR